jgi:hypothetical protein
VRTASAVWEFSVVQVPVSELFCLYDDPGVQPDNEDGLMGSIGLSPTGHAGARIVDLAARLSSAMTRGLANGQNPALSKVIQFRDGGMDFIRSRAEPFALSHLTGMWFVREGTHRAVAVTLLGAQFVEGIDFESGRLILTERGAAASERAT